MEKFNQEKNTWNGQNKKYRNREKILPLMQVLDDVLEIVIKYLNCRYSYNLF